MGTLTLTANKMEKLSEYQFSPLCFLTIRQCDQCLQSLPPRLPNHDGLCSLEQGTKINLSFLKLLLSDILLQREK